MIAVFLMAPYGWKAPFDVHGLLRQAIAEAGMTEKEIYSGRMDGSQWVKAVTGQQALDLVMLVNLLPLKVWMVFGPRMLAAIVSHWMESKKQEVA